MSVACRLLFYFYEHGTLTLVKQFSSFQVEIYSQCHNSFIFVDNYYEHEFLRFFTKSFLRVYFLDVFFQPFPKGEAVLKKKLQEELFNLVRLLNSYIVNRNSNRIKEKHIKDFIISLSMVDFYFEYLYLNKIISFKKYKTLIDEVITIRKLAYGVLKNEKELC